MNGFYIIGAGKTGSAFGIELSNAGYHVGYITDRNSNKALQLADILNANYSTEINDEFIYNSKYILLAVQDRYIEDIAGNLKEYVKDKILIHISGSLTSDVLKVKHGASFHPIQTFSGISKENTGLLSGIYFGIETKSIIAEEFLIEVCQKLNSKYIKIAGEDKPLYHTASVIASNFLVSYMNIISDLVQNYGGDKNNTYDIYKPIIYTTLKNIEKDGILSSLTGPIERNDVSTVIQHIESLKAKMPYLIPFYALLSLETVRTAFDKGSLNEQEKIKMINFLNEYLIQYLNSK